MAKQPNLVYVFTDEQAAHTMAAYGNSQIETPNMDRLARLGVTFERAYVTQAVCTPSRSTLMTGLYPHTTGCTENNMSLPKQTPCLPELGSFEGYALAYHGKWHLGDEVFPQHGFQEWVSIDDGYRDYYGPDRDRSVHSTYYHWLVSQGFRPDATTKDGFEHFSRGFCARLPEEYSKPFYVANEACRFIRQNRERPFILVVNFFEPHMPYFGPRDGQYDPADVILPPNFDHLLDETNPLKTRLFRAGYYERGHSGLPLRTEADWRRIIANYWGLCSLVDTNLGRILDTLETNNLLDDTIIVFTSDHGDMMGSHRLLAKCVQFEEAVRVPLLLHLPGLTESGNRVSEPVSQIDLVPTLLEAMGQGVPDHLQGKSWLPFLRGEAHRLPQEDVFIEWNGYNNGFGDVLGGISIPPLWLKMADEASIRASVGDPARTIVSHEGWKLNWSTIGEDELYDLNEDPFETHNLHRDIAYAQIVAELRARIRRWQAYTADSVPLPD